MGMLKIIHESQVLHENITTNGIGDQIAVGDAKTVCVQVLTNAEALDPAAVAAGVSASLVVQDLTYTAILRGGIGNTYTIRYLNNTPGGPITVNVNANNVTVNMDATLITGSTATAIKTALDLSLPFSSIMTVAVTGTGSTVQTAAAQTPLAGGVESGVDVSADSFASNDYRYGTGLVGRWTSTGTLPTGLSLATDYYVIRLSDNAFQVADSVEGALAGTPVGITTQGTSGATHTFTPTALAGAQVLLQGNNDPNGEFSEWVTITTEAITGSENFFMNLVDPGPKYIRVGGLVTSGQFSFVATTIVKGYA